LLGAVLVGLGALFLAARVFHISLIGYLWPFFIIVPGVMCFVVMVIAGKEHAKAFGLLSIPGAIVTMTGLLLLYQNTFNHWESWAYAWALIPASAGIGIMLFGTRIDSDFLLKSGRRTASIGLILLLVFGTFFEFVLRISENILCSTVWPVLLVALGAYWLTRTRRDDPAPEVKPAE
jgi:hypothetical protein